MRNKSGFSFALSAAFLAVLLCCFAGGCGGSSGTNKTQNSRNQLISSIGDVADDLSAIADSAFSNGKVLNAIDDIISQYTVLATDDTTVINKVIGRLFMSDVVVSSDIIGNPSFDVAVYIKPWSNKHITVKNGAVTDFVTNQSDFQLTITSSDNHVTKLTITPASSTGYWQAFSGVSILLNNILAERFNATLGKHSYLLLAYSYSSANVKVEYDGTVLLEGTINLSYPTKTAVTPDTIGEPVDINSPHTSKFNITLHPQDNKDYDVKLDFERNVQSNNVDSLSSESTLKLYRQTAAGLTGTIFEINAGMDASVSTGALMPSSISIRKLNINIADKIEISQSGILDLTKLITLYFTRGSDVSEAELESIAAQINAILSKAGLSFYLNNNILKAGDVRVAIDKIQGYDHVRFGVQFTDSNEVEFVRAIANPEDLQKMKTLIGRMSSQVQMLAQLLTNSGILDDVGGNQIIKLIFEDLFGTN